MSTATVELPDSLKNRIEALAAKEGYTVSQFLASAAGEKLAAMLTMDYLRREASAGRREDFDKYLAAVPDVAAPENDRLAGDAVTPGGRTTMAKKRNEQTSKRVASKAGKILRNPKSTKAQKSVAASALTQAANKKKRKKK
jgi:predicted transcriptional regulator